jgi:hypothetical protein
MVLRISYDARAGVRNSESDENDENGSIRFREMSLFVRNTLVVSHMIPEDEEPLSGAREGFFADGLKVIERGDAEVALKAMRGRPTSASSSRIFRGPATGQNVVTTQGQLERGGVKVAPQNCLLYAAILEAAILSAFVAPIWVKSLSAFISS